MDQRLQLPVNDKREMLRRATVASTPVLGCPACDAKRIHTCQEYFTFHPDAGKGKRKGEAQ
jgi:hypothetical protein